METKTCHFLLSVSLSIQENRKTTLKCQLRIHLTSKNTILKNSISVVYFSFSQWKIKLIIVTRTKLDFNTAVLRGLFSIYLSYSHTLFEDALDYSLSFSLSSVPGEPERVGWGGGPTRAKVSAPLGPDLESDEEPEAAKTGLDFWAGIAVKERCTKNTFWRLKVIISN